MKLNLQSEPILNRCREAQIRLTRFLYCDNGGLIRGKTTATQGLAHRLTDGIGLTVAMMAMNSLDQLQPVDGMGAVGEGAHAAHESIFIEHLAPRTALLAGMLAAC